MTLFLISVSCYGNVFLVVSIFISTPVSLLSYMRISALNFVVFTSSRLKHQKHKQAPAVRPFSSTPSLVSWTFLPAYSVACWWYELKVSYTPGKNSSLLISQVFIKMARDCYQQRTSFSTVRVPWGAITEQSVNWLCLTLSALRTILFSRTEVTTQRQMILKQWSERPSSAARRRKEHNRYTNSATSPACVLVFPRPSKREAGEN
jgi:hypothetical protein